MVRLVFRPYTQIRRTICTSVSLRASTRVSPGFTLFRHRSPSFGSQQICSYSNLSQVTIGRQCLDCSIPTSAAQGCLYFHCASGFSTQILAYMLDSLVRVSRRVDRNYLVRITIVHTALAHHMKLCIQHDIVIHEHSLHTCTAPSLVAHYDILSRHHGTEPRL